MFLLQDSRLHIRDSTTTELDSSGEPLDNIYTDSNDDGATVDGQSVHYGPSVREKIVAFGSIGIFVVAFTIYLYFYISPIYREKRRAAEAKRLRSPSGTPLTEKIGLPSRDSSFSFSFIDKTEAFPSSPERPLRIIHRDSVGIVKAKRTASFFDLEPFLDSFPLPPSREHTSQYERPSGSPPPSPTSTITRFNAPSPSYPGLGIISEMNQPTANHFLALPSFPKLAPIVVLSDSLNDVSNGRVLVSPNRETNMRQSSPKIPFSDHVSLLATFPPKEPATVLNPLNTSRSRSQVLFDSQAVPNAAPLAGVSSAPTIWSAEAQQTSMSRQPTPQLTEATKTGPVYADVILPAYCRSQSHADSLRLHSHKIRDSVFVRAANYAQKIVNPSSPQKETMELHFEMVKGDHGV